MSRVGRQPIEVPSGVEVTIDNAEVKVKGPNGELSQALVPGVDVVQKDNQVLVSVKDASEKSQNSLWGLYRKLIANMVTGVSEGFSKQLEVNGVGYKVALSGKKLVLNLGYSHPIEYEFPEGIDIKVEKNIITISGIDKQQVGQVASEIRSFRKPEPYKGKGIKYIDEVIRRKVGKAAGKTE